MYMYYGIRSDFYDQHNTQHTESYDRVRMHVYLHLAIKELIITDVICKLINTDVICKLINTDVICKFYLVDLL